MNIVILNKLESWKLGTWRPDAGLWKSDRRHGPPLKAALSGLYVSLAALLANTYNAAVSADEKGLDGGTAGWFGDKWLFVLAALIVAIVVLHVAALVKKQPRT